MFHHDSLKKSNVSKYKHNYTNVKKILEVGGFGLHALHFALQFSTRLSAIAILRKFSLDKLRLCCLIVITCVSLPHFGTWFEGKG